MEDKFSRDKPTLFSSSVLVKSIFITLKSLHLMITEPPEAGGGFGFLSTESIM